MLPEFILTATACYTFAGGRRQELDRAECLKEQARPPLVAAQPLSPKTRDLSVTDGETLRWLRSSKKSHP